MRDCSKCRTFAEEAKYLSGMQHCNDSEYLLLLEYLLFYNSFYTLFIQENLSSIFLYIMYFYTAFCETYPRKKIQLYVCSYIQSISEILTGSNGLKDYSLNIPKNTNLQQSTFQLLKCAGIQTYSLEQTATLSQNDKGFKSIQSET